MDVDLSTDLAALRPLVAPLLSGHSHVAIGTRLARASRVVRGPRRELISRAYNLLLHGVLGVGFSDAQCGFKAVRADVARELLPLVADEEWFLDTELLVLAERAGLRIHEVPVDWVDDPDSRVDVVATAAADLRGIARLARDLRAGPPAAGRGRERLGAARPRAAGRPGGSAPAVRTGRWPVDDRLRPAVPAARRPIGPQPANLVALLLTAVGNTAANRRLTFGVRGAAGLVRHQGQGLAVFLLGWALTAGALAWVHAAGPPDAGGRARGARRGQPPGHRRCASCCCGTGCSGAGMSRTTPQSAGARRRPPLTTSDDDRHPPMTARTIDGPRRRHRAAGAGRPSAAGARGPGRTAPRGPALAHPGHAGSARRSWRCSPPPPCCTCGVWPRRAGPTLLRGRGPGRATSWKAFLYGASDAAASITVDKPPFSLWPMALSVRVFGLSSWSMLVPQALMGVATVAVVSRVGRRVASAGAALLAGAVLAVTPVAALMFRYDNPDAMLVLLLSLTAAAVLRGVEDGRTRWMLLAGALVGLAFLTKQLEAFLALPAMAPGLAGRGARAPAQAAAGRAAGGRWRGARRRVVGRAGGAGAGVRPALDRRVETNSFLELTFGYNGFGRLTGNETGSIGGGGSGLQRPRSAWPDQRSAVRSAGCCRPPRCSPSRVCG